MKDIFFLCVVYKVLTFSKRSPTKTWKTNQNEIEDWEKKVEGSNPIPEKSETRNFGWINSKSERKLLPPPLNVYGKQCDILFYFFGSEVKPYNYDTI